MEADCETEERRDPLSSSGLAAALRGAPVLCAQDRVTGIFLQCTLARQRVQRPPCFPHWSRTPLGQAQLAWYKDVLADAHGLALLHSGCYWQDLFPSVQPLPCDLCVQVLKAYERSSRELSDYAVNLCSVPLQVLYGSTLSSYFVQWPFCPICGYRLVTCMDMFQSSDVWTCFNCHLLRQLREVGDGHGITEAYGFLICRGCGSLTEGSSCRRPRLCVVCADDPAYCCPDDFTSLAVLRRVVHQRVSGLWLGYGALC